MEGYKKAINLLNKYVPNEPDRRKPIIPHSVRVGEYLLAKNYSDDIVIAGLLHDVFEWTNISEDLILKEFNKKVFDLISAV